MLGPEMKSTGEVMGVGQTFGEAFYKAVLGSNERLPGLPTEGEVKHAFLSVRESDKKYIANIAKQLIEYGFKLVATNGTHRVLKEAGIECEAVNKVTEGRPHIVDRLKNGEIHLIVNTTEGKQAQYDSAMIRRAALQGKVYYTTTINGSEAVCQAFAVKLPMDVYRLQDLTVG
jgi:carbamoyl-phosphate synthase large subunit